jgi:SAM-dependent methyltransferase
VSAAGHDAAPAPPQDQAPGDQAPGDPATGDPATEEEARANRAYWDAYADEYQRDHGPQLRAERAWGVWSIPDDQVGALGPVEGLDVLELGCGAAQWSIHLRRAGARVTGIDNSSVQLGHARQLVRGTLTDAMALPLAQADAARLPFADGSFDVVCCDHGAMSYADPARTLPEVRRVLRAGGRLVFNQLSPWASVCWDELTTTIDGALHAPYFDLGRWEDVEGFVSFESGYGPWIRRFRAHGFVVDDLIELQPSGDARTSYEIAPPLAWARRWPAEHIWCVHKP